jgi:hypothetical protein
LADGATKQAPGSAVGSLAPAGTSPSPNPRRCRRRRRRPQVHGSAAQCAVGWSWWSRMSVQCRRAEVALSKYSVASTRPRVPASPRPVSGVRVTVRCPRRCPRIRCPMSGVWTSRCPGVGCPRVRVRVRGVCTGDFVERVGAAGRHTARRAGSGRPAVSANGTTIGLSQGGFCSGLSGVAADACSGCRRRPRSVDTVEGPGPSRLLDADDALTCSVGSGGEGI